MFKCKNHTLKGSLDQETETMKEQRKRRERRRGIKIGREIKAKAKVKVKRKESALHHHQKRETRKTLLFIILIQIIRKLKGKMTKYLSRGSLDRSQTHHTSSSLNSKLTMDQLQREMSHMKSRTKMKFKLLFKNQKVK